MLLITIVFISCLQAHPELSDMLTCVSDHHCLTCLQDEISSLKSKLEECKGQLQSNEQMIRWLNNQVFA